MSLRLDWATHEAAKYACQNWHYSKSMPIGGTVKIGVWENDKFIGVVIFSHGTAKDLGTRYNLSMYECVELTRVALTKHDSPVSKILAISIKLLKKQAPKLKLIVSFADYERFHHGGIYQAGNWIYTGTSERKKYFLNGKEIPCRTYFEKFKNDRSIKDKVVAKKSRPKFRYLFPLDEKVREIALKLKKPYPKRVGSKDNVALADQAKEDGVNPIPTLQSKLLTLTAGL